jgi:ADP-heptose:LPS heptosyltransferase
MKVRLEALGLALIGAFHVALCRWVLRRPSPGADARDNAPLLVIRCEAKLGDNLLTVPFLRALRQGFPNREIHVLHHPAARPVYANCPYVDRRIELDWEPSSVTALLRRLHACRRLLEAHHDYGPYAVAVTPRLDRDLYAPFLAWFSGAAKRIGCSRQVRRGGAVHCFVADSLYTEVLCDAAPRHESLRPLALLKPLGLDEAAPSHLEFWFSETDDAAAKAQLRTASPTQWIAIAPGASNARREWPLERFAAVASSMAIRFGVRVAILGSAGELGICTRLAQLIGDSSRNLAGQLSIPQCAAVLARCRLFICNDSGLAHLASAVALPVVEVSCHPTGASANHSNAPERFGPTSLGSIVIRPNEPRSMSCIDGCDYDHAHCIEGVSVDAVLAAAVTGIGQPHAVRVDAPQS